jgi:hypothetical protein
MFNVRRIATLLAESPDGVPVLLNGQGTKTGAITWAKLKHTNNKRHPFAVMDMNQFNLKGSKGSWILINKATASLIIVCAIGDNNTELDERIAGQQFMNQVLVDGYDQRIFSFNYSMLGISDAIVRQMYGRQSCSVDYRKVA